MSKTEATPYETYSSMSDLQSHMQFVLEEEAEAAEVTVAQYLAEEIAMEVVEETVLAIITDGTSITSALTSDTISLLTGKAAEATGVDLNPAAIAESTRWALRSKDKAKSLNGLTDLMVRQLWQSSRKTMFDNLPEVTKYWRYAATDACPFCRMMASRGAIYTTRGSAAGAKDYHNFCRCLVFPDTWAPPDYYDEFVQEYKDARKAGFTNLNDIVNYGRRRDYAKAAETASGAKKSTLVSDVVKGNKKLPKAKLAPSKPTLQSAKTFDELEEVFMEKHPEFFISQTTENVDLELARDTMIHIDSLKSKHVNTHMNEIRFMTAEELGSPDTLAAMNFDGTMKVNASLSKQQMMNKYRHSRDRGWFPNVPDDRMFEATITHEYAHSLDFQAWIDSGAKIPPSMDAVRNVIFAEDKVNRIDNVKDWLNTNGLSRYGQTSGQEAFAEAYADVMINGKKASRAHRLIYEDTMRRMPTGATSSAGNASRALRATTEDGVDPTDAWLNSITKDLADSKDSIDLDLEDQHMILEDSLAEVKPKYKQADLDRVIAGFNESIASGTARFADGATIVIRVPDEIMPKILADGRFKSQHETFESMGEFDPTIRANMEQKWFLTRDHPMFEAKDPPLYGVWENYADGVEETVLKDTNSFGNVHVRLKSSVKSRSTLSNGDSLNSGTNPGIPGSALPEDSMMLGNWYDATPFINKRGYDIQAGADDVYEKLRNPDSLYVEAQIHGGVSVSDIDVVEFDGTPDPELTKQLDELGITWRKRK